MAAPAGKRKDSARRKREELEAARRSRSAASPKRSEGGEQISIWLSSISRSAFATRASTEA